MSDLKPGDVVWMYRPTKKGLFQQWTIIKVFDNRWGHLSVNNAMVFGARVDLDDVFKTKQEAMQAAIAKLEARKIKAEDQVRKIDEALMRLKQEQPEP